MKSLRIDLGWGDVFAASIRPHDIQFLVGNPMRNHRMVELRPSDATTLWRWLQRALSGSGKPRLVIMESPFAGDVERNTRYARACMADCLARGEAPFASHLLYTQPGVLDDTVPEQRSLGIDAGLAWGLNADATVAYQDLGVSTGMQLGIDAADEAGRTVERRSLPGWGPDDLT